MKNAVFGLFAQGEMGFEPPHPCSHNAQPGWAPALTPAHTETPPPGSASSACREQERRRYDATLEYLRNVTLQFLACNNAEVRRRLVPERMALGWGVFGRTIPAVARNVSFLESCAHTRSVVFDMLSDSQFTRPFPPFYH